MRCHDGRMRHCHEHRFAQQIRARGAQGVADDGAPVLTHKIHGLAFPNDFDQASHVLHQRGFVVIALCGNGGRVVAAQIRRNRTKARLRQRIHLVLPSMCRVWETVQQQYLGAAALSQAMKLQTIGVNLLHELLSKMVVAKRIGRLVRARCRKHSGLADARACDAVASV